MEDIDISNLRINDGEIDISGFAGKLDFGIMKEMDISSIVGDNGSICDLDEIMDEGIIDEDIEADKNENIYMVEYNCLSCLKNDGVYGNGACVHCGYMFCGCYDICRCK